MSTASRRPQVARTASTCASTLLAVTLAAASSAQVQQPAPPAPTDSGVLENAPGVSATLHGTVTDSKGSRLPGARIEVLAGPFHQSGTSDAAGEFHLSPLPAGGFTLRVAAPGFQSQASTGSLTPGEQRELPPIALAPAEVAAVTVMATEHDIATAEVNLEEKQRVLGVIPNFYVVYVPRPAPLSAGQKFHLAWRSTIDPVSFLGTGIVAGFEQAGNQFSGYQQGGIGYARRYGADFADGAISTFIGGAILPSLFHQDPRYYYQGTGSISSRTWHAVSSVVITHGDSGKLQFNASNVLGSFASAGISNLYYPPSDRHGAGLTMSNAATGIAFGAFAALMQEFVVRKLTPHVPNYGGAKTRGQ